MFSLLFKRNDVCAVCSPTLGDKDPRNLPQFMRGMFPSGHWAQSEKAAAEPDLHSTLPGHRLPLSRSPASRADE